MSGAAGRDRALAGREVERALFTHELELAAQGRPRLLLLEGEPGIGRSALLDEIEASPMLPGRMRVVRVDVPDHDAADPVLLAARAASRHYGFMERLGGRRRVGRLVTKLLPEWIGAIPGVGDVLEASLATAEAVRKRRRPRRAAKAAPEDVETLIGVARRRPLALLIDDLHRVGESGVERVRRLVADAETGVRLLVVATCRTPQLGAPRAAAHRLPERLDANRVVHRRLEPLTAEEVGAWLAGRESVAPVDVDALLRETGGVPGAVMAALDRVGQGAAEPTSGKEADGADPAIVAGVALPAAVADALRAAASLPTEFDALALADRLGRGELEVEDDLAMAVRAGALVNLGVAELADGELSTRYRFTSTALRARFHRSAAALADAAPAEP